MMKKVILRLYIITKILHNSKLDINQQNKLETMHTKELMKFSLLLTEQNEITFEPAASKVSKSKTLLESLLSN